MSFAQRTRGSSLIAPAPTSEDLKDPNVEVFPETRAGILHRIQTMKNEIPIDDSFDSESEADLTHEPGVYAHHPRKA